MKRPQLIPRFGKGKSRFMQRGINGVNGIPTVISRDERKREKETPAPPFGHRSAPRIPSNPRAPQGLLERGMRAIYVIFH